MNAMSSATEKFTLATQIYVRLRRTGRVIDAVHMVENDEYAQKILAMAGSQQDEELRGLVGRYLALFFPQAAPPVVEAAPPPPVISAPPVAEPMREPSSTQDEVAQHYIGALR